MITNIVLLVWRNWVRNLLLLAGSNACFGIMFFVTWMCFPSFALRHTFLSFDININRCTNETKTSTCRDISSHFPYMLTFFSHIGHFLYIRQQKRGTMWGETRAAQLEFVYNTMAQHTWFNYMSLNQAYVIKCRYFWCSLPEYASHHKTLVWAYM